MIEEEILVGRVSERRMIRTVHLPKKKESAQCFDGFAAHNVNETATVDDLEQSRKTHFRYRRVVLAIHTNYSPFAFELPIISALDGKRISHISECRVQPTHPCYFLLDLLQ